MTTNYNYLTGIMEAIRSGQPLTNEELLQELGRVAEGMLNIQRDHVEATSDAKEQEFLIGEINLKKESLNNYLSSNSHGK